MEENQVNKVYEYSRNLNNTKSNLIDVVSEIGSTGDLKEIYNVDVILNSIVNILSIVKGTYVFDPDFGCALCLYLFEPCDNTTLQKIKNEVKRQVSIYEARATIDIDVRFLYNKKGFSIDITVSMDDQVRKSTVIINESVLKSIR